MDTLRIAHEIPRLRHYALALTHDHADADDLVQNCLVLGLVKSHQWREGTNLRAWLFAILHNQFISMKRHEAVIGTTLALDECAPPIQLPNQETRLLIRDFVNAYGKLSENHQAVIEVFATDDLSQEEIAALLGIPRGTVTSRASRARQLLRDQMNGTSGMNRTSAGGM